jgi:hypothetical protein
MSATQLIGTIMRHEKQTSLSLLKAFICAIFCVGVMAMAHAQGTNVDPSGTWTWTNPGRDGSPGRTNTLVLKYSNNALTGTLKAPTRGGGTTNLDIADGKLAGDQISFTITREFNGNSMTATYAGGVTADAIKGTIATERDGEKRSRKWEATRAAATETK